MPFLKRFAIVAVFVATIGTPAMAADLMMQPPAPAAAMTSGWDGAYVGVTGGYYDGGYLDGDLVLGGNLTFSEMFLIGAEVGAGGYIGLGGGGSGLEAYVAGRAGFIASDAVLIYGTGGFVAYPGSGGDFFGGLGVEFKATDNMSIRGQAVVYDVGGYNVSAGAFWHF